MKVLKDDEEELLGSYGITGCQPDQVNNNISERVDAILDKEVFTLEELLDEDGIIQECKSLNNRLISFLRERTQLEQLVRYIVEEPPQNAENGRAFKFPFIAGQIFTCEANDIILNALVEDETLMNMLFSFLEPEHPHSTHLAAYFSKVVVYLLLWKRGSLMNYIQAHQDIIRRLVDNIGVTSIMEVLICLIGGDDASWLEDTDVVEMIVDKLSSTDCRLEGHANAAEALCAITRRRPPELASKISSPSFIARLFHDALEESRPKSVLFHSLSVCISLLDPKRHKTTSSVYNRRSLPGPAKPETVEGMLESLASLVKLLDVSAEEGEESVLFTTYGKLQPPLGKIRLKILEFISVLMTIGGEAAGKELIRLGALKRILELFFEYPYNNLAHQHIEHVIDSCLESTNVSLIQHILEDCHLVSKILDAEKNCALDAPPALPAEGRTPPRIGYVGHMTRIANKLITQGANNTYIDSYLQGHSEWAEWHAGVLTKRNALENVYQWACGRPHIDRVEIITAFSNRLQRKRIKEGKVRRAANKSAIASRPHQESERSTDGNDGGEVTRAISDESTLISLLPLELPLESAKC